MWEVIADVSGLGRILIIGPLSYLAAVVLMRVSGKRSLSKMNSFDFIVTVALGSMLATIILDDSISLVEGAVALSILLLGQLVITFLSVRSQAVLKAVKAKPALIFHRGSFVDGALLRERVTREEVLAAARSSGHASLETVHAVVLESDGSFSVLTTSSPGDEAGIPNVRRGGGGIDSPS